MSADLFSVTQKEKRTFSFMSQALGLMADLDVGTDNLRWMGPIRFTVGFLRGGKSFHWCTTVIDANAEHILSCSNATMSYRALDQSCRGRQNEDGESSSVAT